jgi:hypothetical protein
VNDEKNTPLWRNIARISLVLGIIVAIITILGFIRGLSSPNQAVNAGSQLSASSQPTSTATGLHVSSPTDIPTATPRPKPGDVLYQANWSSGLNGWVGESDWQSLNGTLVNTGQCCGDSTILAPYNPGVLGLTDYAVQAQIQYVSDPSGTSAFGIVVRSPSP